MLIQIAHVGADAQTLVALRVDPPATVADALRLAGADPRFAGVDLQSAAVGIFGTLVAREHILVEGDRVEVYGVPAVDPKLARRRRASGKSFSKPARS